MSGQWVLNTKKSKWGKKKAAQNLVLDIRHQEPKFSYSGELTQDVEGQMSKFSFDGAIDGKEYPVRQDGVERKAVYTRKNKYVIDSKITSMDGRSVEQGTTMISPDGKTLTRTVYLKGPDGEARWTEVYDKQ